MNIGLISSYQTGISNYQTGAIQFSSLSKSQPQSPLQTSFVSKSPGLDFFEDPNLSFDEGGLDNVSMASYSTNNFSMLDEDERRHTVEFFEELIVLINKLKAYKELAQKPCEARLEELWQALCRLAGVNTAERDLLVQELQNLFLDNGLPEVVDIEYLNAYFKNSEISQDAFVWLLSTVDMDRRYPTAPHNARPPVDAKQCLSALHKFTDMCVVFVRDLARLRQDHTPRIFSIFSLVSHDGVMNIQSLGNHVTARGDDLREVIKLIQGTHQSKINIAKFRQFMEQGYSTI